jgi:hypothetical protein
MARELFPRIASGLGPVSSPPRPTCFQRRSPPRSAPVVADAQPTQKATASTNPKTVPEGRGIRSPAHPGTCWHSAEPAGLREPLLLSSAVAAVVAAALLRKCVRSRFPQLHRACAAAAPRCGQHMTRHGAAAAGAPSDSDDLPRASPARASLAPERSWRPTPHILLLSSSLMCFFF